jgi:hypothetical protein
MKRFLRRVPDGGGILPVINPASLQHLEIYYSGLTGVNPNTEGSDLTSWDDQSGNGRNLSVAIPGASAPLVHTTAQGLKAGTSCIELIDGASPRGKERTSLPNPFTQVRGSTQYVLAKMVSGNVQVWHPFYWPIGGSNGPALYWQGPGKNGGGGAVWNGTNVPAGNMALVINNTGYDIGRATVANTWELWTVVSTTANHHLVYRNGVLVGDIVTTAYNLTSEIDFGARPSSGTQQSGRAALYILYTDTHSAGTIAAVHGWVAGNYGIP